MALAPSLCSYLKAVKKMHKKKQNSIFEENLAPRRNACEEDPQEKTMRKDACHGHINRVQNGYQPPLFATGVGSKKVTWCVRAEQAAVQVGPAIGTSLEQARRPGRVCAEIRGGRTTVIPQSPLSCTPCEGRDWDLALSIGLLFPPIVLWLIFQEEIPTFEEDFRPTKQNKRRKRSWETKGKLRTHPEKVSTEVNGKRKRGIKSKTVKTQDKNSTEPIQGYEVLLEMNEQKF